MNEAAEALHALTRNGEDAVEAKVRKGVFPSVRVRQRELMPE